MAEEGSQKVRSVLTTAQREARRQNRALEIYNNREVINSASIGRGFYPQPTRKPYKWRRGFGFGALGAEMHDIYYSPLACDGCFKPGKEICPDTQMCRCSACNFAHYCSKKCQEAHWLDSHKSECKLLQKAFPQTEGGSTQYYHSRLAELVGGFTPVARFNSIMDLLGGFAPTGSYPVAEDLFLHMVKCSSKLLGTKVIEAYVCWVEEGGRLASKDLNVFAVAVLFHILGKVSVLRQQRVMFEAIYITASNLLESLEEDAGKHELHQTLTLFPKHARGKYI
jgi:hypothetical protein